MSSNSNTSEEQNNSSYKALRGPKLASKLGLKSSRFDESSMSIKAEESIAKIKKKERSYLRSSEWQKYKYYKTDHCRNLLISCPNQIDRIHYSKLSVEDFVNKYEKQHKPIIIQGLEELNFPIKKYWTFNEIYERYKDIDFKVGEDDDGHKLRLRLKYFYEYLIYQKDDNPLYLFESAIEDIKRAKDMINHYEIPPYFKDDIFNLLSEHKRPPHRWFLMGPERSGTTVHIDPLYTSAWNMSLQGHKRWVLFPNYLPKSVVKGKEFINKGDDDEALAYFVNILPKIKAKEGEFLKPIEFIQYPGDLVFVPGGWWHAVINLDNTMALTQNFLSTSNFDLVWRSLRKERKKLSCKLLDLLKIKNPKFYEKAIELNKLDGFIMFNEKNKLKRKIDNDISEFQNSPKKNRKLSMSSDTDSSSSSSSSDNSSESDSK